MPSSVAETSPYPNNVSVKFKGKPARETSKLPKGIKHAHKRGLITNEKFARIKEGKSP